LSSSASWAADFSHGVGPGLLPTIDTGEIPVELLQQEAVQNATDSNQGFK